MANTIETYPVTPPDSDAGRRDKESSTLWSRIALGIVALISIFMNFFQLGQNGYGNLYYAAGVRSMGDSLPNFFFVSFDPGGFVTIDKPPLGFWLQVISTKIFGFTPFSIFFPQALCGVLAVILLYYLVRRHFGIVAGLAAALVLALSPISVVTSRNNTIDGTLALALLLAAWAVIRAAETGKLRWLLLSALFVGIGFNIKMSEAYLIIPALGLTYLLCAPRRIWTRIWHLALALLVMLLISLSWAATVDLTPAAQRPYVGSTQNNSELSLAFGYNGLNRLHIGNTGPGRAGRGATNNTANNTRSSSSQNNNQGSGVTPGANSNSQNTANQLEEALGAGFRAGAGSPLALFSSSMGGQIGWLIPFALLAIVALAWQRRFHFQKDRQQLGLILWGFWLLTMAIFFTLDGSFHQYYMTEMAPGLSAMVGIGLVIMWKDYCNPGWRGWLLPIALILTAAIQINILAGYPSWSQWLSPLIAVLTALVVITLLVFRLRPRISLNTSVAHIAGVTVAGGLLALLIAPTIWASYSVMHNVESSDPTAGPNIQANDGAGGFGGFGGGQQNNANRARANDRSQSTQNGLNSLFAGFQGGGNGQADPALISYLEAHQGNTKFLVATPSSSSADAIILSTNKPVMAMGGFGGSDPILTTTDLQNLIQNGTVHFFLINSPRATQQALNQIPEQFRNRFSGRGGGFGGFGGFGQSSALSSWISSHCTQVPTSDWHTSTSNTGAGLNGTQLYNCASANA